MMRENKFQSRLLAMLLVLAFLVTMVPALGPLPVFAEEPEPGGEPPATTEKTEEIDASTYEAMGLPVASELPEEALDGGGFGLSNSFNLKNELYVSANGNAGSSYSVRKLIRPDIRPDTNFANGTGTHFPNYDLTRGYIGDDSGNNIFGGTGFYRVSNAISGYNSRISGAFGSNINGKDGDVDHVLSIETAGATTTLYSTAEAMKLGRDEGENSLNISRLNVVAELVLFGSGQDYRTELHIDRIKDNGDKEPLRVVNLDPSEVMSKRSGNYAFGAVAFAQEFAALFEITTGDYNNDGFDDVAVYFGGQDVQVFSGERLYYAENNASTDELLLQSIPVGFAATGDDYNSYPIVTMTSGDLKRNNICQLAIARTAGAYAANFANGESVTIYAWDSEAKALKSEFSDSLVIKSEAADATRAMCAANLDIGYIAGKTVDEEFVDAENVLFIGGYAGTGKTPGAIDKTKVMYAAIIYNQTSGDFEWAPKPQIIDNLRQSITGYMGSSTNYYLAPMSVAFAALDGRGTVEQQNDDTLLFNTMLYTVKKEAGVGGEGSEIKITKREQTSGFCGARLPITILQTKASITGGEKSHFWVGDVRAGNITGDEDGKEVFVAELGRRYGGTYYWYDLAYLGKVPDAVASGHNGRIFSSAENVVAKSKASSSQAGHFSLALPDVNRDTAYLTMTSAQIRYTNPVVLAVMQSAPYYEDVENAMGYLNAGSTSYGKQSGFGSTISAGAYGSVGTYTSGNVGAGVKGEFEVQASITASVDVSSSWSRETSTTRTADAGDDYVVIYTVPHWIYTYDLISFDAAKNEYSTEILVTQTPRDAVTTIIPVDEYDAIAAKTKGLEQIRGKILFSTPGKPETYSSFPVGVSRTVGKKETVTTSSKTHNTLSETITLEGSAGASVTTEINGKVGGGGGITVFGVGGELMSGATFGAGATVGYTFTASTGVECSGTVDNLPSELTGQPYGFDWEFGVGKTKLNGRYVQVIGYKVSDTQPVVPMPQDLKIAAVSSDSITLDWERGNGVRYYEIYMVTPNDEFLLVTLPGTANRYTHTGLQANTEYSYKIRASAEPTGYSIFSPVRTGKTMAVAGASFNITKQPKDQTGYVGERKTFQTAATYTVPAGNSNTLQYRWQYWNEATRKWVNVTAGGTTASLTVEVNKNTDGNQYRCQIIPDLNAVFYTQTATLRIGKAVSNTTLSLAVGNEPIDPSKTATVAATGSQMVKETEEVTPQIPIVVTGEKDSDTGKIEVEYTLMQVPGVDTKIWLCDNVYYPYKGTETPTAATIANIDTENPCALTEPTQTFTYEDSGTQTVTVSDTFTALTAPFEEKKVGEITYALIESVVADGSTSTVYYASYKVDGDEGDSFTYLVKDGSNNYYLADATLADGAVAKVIIGGKEYDVTALTVCTVEGAPQMIETVTEKTLPGTEITLTAEVSEANTTAISQAGSVSFELTDSAGNVTSVPAKLEDNTYTAKWTPTESGTYSVVASYAGSNKFLPSRSDAQKLITVRQQLGGAKSLTLTGGTITVDETHNLAPVLWTLASGDTTPSSSSLGTLNDYTVTITRNEDESNPAPSYALSGTSFTPTIPGTYVVTATHETEGYSATAKIQVLHKQVKVVAESKIVSASSNDPGETLTKTITPESEAAALSGVKFDLTSEGPGKQNGAAEYPIIVSYAAGTESAVEKLEEKYSIQLVNGLYKVTETTHNVKAESALANTGSVEIVYRASGEDEDKNVQTESGYDLPEKSIVTITAAPNSGYQVAGWKNGSTVIPAKNLSDNSTSYTINSLTEAVNIRVTFQEDTSVVNYSVKGENGTLSAAYKNTGSSFTSGDNLLASESLVLTATPAERYTVSGWFITKGNEPETQIKVPDSEVNLTSKTYTLSEVTEDTTVRVQFEAKGSARSVNVSIVDGDGINIPGAKLSFNGSNVTANANGTFTCDGIYKFDNPSFALTLPNGVGVMDWEAAYSLPEEAPVLQNGVLKKATNSLSATWQNIFSENTVTDETSASITITCSVANRSTVEFYGSIAGGFGSDVGTVTAKLASGGEITSPTSLMTGSKVIFTATAKENFEITGWTVNGQSVSATTTNGQTQTYTLDSLTADAIVVAHFKAKAGAAFPVSYEANGATVTIKVGSTTYENGKDVPYGSEVVFTATPISGFEITGWKLGDTQVTPTKNADGTESYTIPFLSKPETVYVTCAQTNYLVEFGVADGGNGSVTATADGALFDTGANKPAGTEIIFTAEPAADNIVSEWTVGGKTAQIGGTEFTIPNLSGDVNVKVSFVAAPDPTEQYTVSFDKAGSGVGTIEATLEGEGSFSSPQDCDAGSKITFTATPNAGYQISGWTLNGGTVTGTKGSNGVETYEIGSLTANATVVVSFEALPTYKVTFSAGTSGSLTAISGSSSVTTGDKLTTGSSVTFTATPNEGYNVAVLTVNSNPVTLTNNTYTISNLREDVTVSVSFTKPLPEPTATYKVNFSADSGGRISATSGGTAIDSGDTLNAGSTITFTATPNTGYKVKAWSGGGASGSGKTFTINSLSANVSVSVSFEKEESGGNQPPAGGGGGGGGGGVVITPPAKETFTVTEYYHDANGGQVLSATTSTVEKDAKYSKTAPQIKGYACTGYIIGSGAVKAGKSVSVSGVSENFSVTFIYQPSEDEPSIGSESILQQIKTQDKNGVPFFLNEKGEKVFVGMSQARENRILFFAPRTNQYDVSPNPKEFPDVEGHWAFEAIMFNAEREIFNGMPDGSFAPNGDMTRGMFAMVLARLSMADLSSSFSLNFGDVTAEDWYAAAVAWASLEKVVLGDELGNFNPNNSITREEAAVMIYRFIQAYGPKLEEDRNLPLFNDAGNVSDWAKDGVDFLRITGLIEGSEGNFNPKDNITRAEISVILERMIEKILDRFAAEI